MIPTTYPYLTSKFDEAALRMLERIKGLGMRGAVLLRYEPKEEALFHYGYCREGIVGLESEVQMGGYPLVDRLCLPADIGYDAATSDQWAGVRINNIGTESRTSKLDKLAEYCGVGSIANLACVPIGIEIERTGLEEVRRELAGIALVLNYMNPDKVVSRVVGADDLTILQGITGDFSSFCSGLISSVYMRDREITREILASVSADPGKLLEIGSHTLAHRIKQQSSCGGDSFNYWKDKDGGYHFWIFDVSGKGLGAAHITKDVYTLLRAGQGLYPNPAEMGRVVGFVNDSLRALYPDDKFVTMFYGRLDNGRNLSFVNAGHEAVLVARPDGDSAEVISLEEGNIPLGVLPGIEYSIFQYILREMDRVVGFSDGLTDLMNPGNIQFGRDRVRDVLAKNIGQGADELADILVDEAERFRGRAVQFDDLTLFVIEPFAKHPKF
ncbi:MAG: serine/threonine-protein phosphatase [Nanoarchaeota archaeon]|nr:serine/threonine-protein phosphatase [Nanoarchaeota archaeon]MBU1946765.1 serine/threonine-protein phosphatase [Nanoarchaeota archaeon]